ncbi:hypothetical protein MTO96_020561 [Rhipicephalus appendiculatus]
MLKIGASWKCVKVRTYESGSNNTCRLWVDVAAHSNDHKTAAVRTGSAMSAYKTPTHAVRAARMAIETGTWGAASRQTLLSVRVLYAELQE